MEGKRGHRSPWRGRGRNVPTSALTSALLPSDPSWLPHSTFSVSAPRPSYTRNNDSRGSSRSGLPNCFLSLLVSFLSEVMNGHGGLEHSLASGTDSFTGPKYCLVTHRGQQGMKVDKFSNRHKLSRRNTLLSCIVLRWK